MIPGVNHAGIIFWFLIVSFTALASSSFIRENRLIQKFSNLSHDISIVHLFNDFNYLIDSEVCPWVRC
jgi:ABC-type polysaccharide/polyol phosphate export permease